MGGGKGDEMSEGERERERYEPRCRCGHGMFSHYMCSLPQHSRCMEGGCECARFSPDPHPPQQQESEK